MKRFVLILVCALMVISPVLAEETNGGNSSFEGSIGGYFTNSVKSDLAQSDFGVGFIGKYNNFNMYAGLRFASVYATALEMRFDLGVSYDVYTLDLGNGGELPFQVGLMLPIGFGKTWPGDTTIFGIVGQVFIGTDYRIPNIPISLTFHSGFSVMYFTVTEKVTTSLYGRIGVNYWF